MPRPSKVIRRQKIDAASDWKKGNRTEAQKMWADADKARKELQAKKKKNQSQTTAGQGESGESEEADEAG